MATSKTRIVSLSLAAFTIGIIVLIWAMRSPAQIGNDHDVFNTVDALFTAVTAKDERRLSECEQRLQGYREAGKLPTAAAATLDSIIYKAHSGSWDRAAERLYDFMRSQRRDEPGERQHSEKKSKNSKGKKSAM